MGIFRRHGCERNRHAVWRHSVHSGVNQAKGTCPKRGLQKAGKSADFSGAGACMDSDISVYIPRSGLCGQRGFSASGMGRLQAQQPPSDSVYAVFEGLDQSVQLLRIFQYDWHRHGGAGSDVCRRAGMHGCGSGSESAHRETRGAAAADPLLCAVSAVPRLCGDLVEGYLFRRGDDGVCLAVP